MRTKGVRYLIWSLNPATRLNPLWCGAKDSPYPVFTKKMGTAAVTSRFAAMVTRFKYLSAPAWCALIAAVGGLLGGTTAVHGLQQNHYGPENPTALFAPRDDMITAQDSYGNGGYETRNAEGCQGCSERDLGYRWATLAAVRSSDQCPNDSWGFRRGCLDYTGGV